MACRGMACRGGAAFFLFVGGATVERWENTFTCPTLGPLVPLFWISGDVSSGFQSQWVLPYPHYLGERKIYVDFM